jgi:hypothetical protein
MHLVVVAVMDEIMTKRKKLAIEEATRDRFSTTQ